MFNAPTPCSNTLSTAEPLNGFLAITIGSCAGFSAVFQPLQSFANCVVGIVFSPPLVPNLSPPSPPISFSYVPTTVFTPFTFFAKSFNSVQSFAIAAKVSSSGIL